MCCIYFATVLNDFVSKWILTRHCDRELIVVNVYYFQILNKKEHSIITTLFSSHIGHMYIYTFIRGEFNKFPDFFGQAFRIVVESWTFTMLLLYILWDDWPIFMISGSNEHLQ